MTDLLAEWRGAFGNAYTDRNRADEAQLRARLRAWARLLDLVPAAGLGSILEVGANLGLNLCALKLLTAAELWAVEPNPRAREALVAEGVVPAERAVDGAAEALPFAEGRFDLVFTCGVLIHIPDATLEHACREIHRVSRRYITCLEYFAPVPMAVAYRGREGMLFKRDYGAIYLDLFPELEAVGEGFFWKRTTGLDDVNWWLFRKPH